MRPSSRSTASIPFLLLLALVLIAQLPSTALAQKDNTKGVTTSTTNNSTAASTTTRSIANAAHTSGPAHQKGPIDDDKAAATIANQTATIIAPLAPLNIPSFTQCEPVIINATGSANPDFNAHDLDIQVSHANGSEYFAETVKGSGKNPSKTPFVWTWAAVDLEAGSQFILSVNQSSSNKHSSKNDKVPKELVLLPPTTYTVGPSPTNQTACLSETAETNHKGKKHRAAQRGQNEVKIIGAVIGSFFALLLLLIGFMALRRRSEARKSAGSGMLEYDDFDDYEGQAKRRASAVSLRNVGSDDLAAAGGVVGGGVTGSSREANAPPASRRKSRAGYKYMSRMVGGPLESVPASEDLNHAGGTSSTSNLYLPHEYGYGVGGGSVGMRRRDSDESAEMGDPFTNNRYTAQYTAMQQQLQLESGSGTALPNSGSMGARERSGSQAQELAAHLLEDDDRDDEAGSRSLGQGPAQAREPLPTYRESAAGRKKRSTAAGARKSRLGADGRIQEGVVVSVRPPMYQDEWRASLGSGAEGSQGSESRGFGQELGQGLMVEQGRQGAGTPDH
ncbi:hypothetical protein A4X09_0g5718 [Tilletia walkeri]|uniref:Mid2 domain-containing protein n=1 Tax=Tilletia walkeri TaxID=117179 RepID=A0A8X7T3S7_9BASI|nr:hypothetical protein A4X09_0g5718 [Tilletia walkeri]